MVLSRLPIGQGEVGDAFNRITKLKSNGGKKCCTNGTWDNINLFYYYSINIIIISFYYNKVNLLHRERRQELVHRKFYVRATNQPQESLLKHKLELMMDLFGKWANSIRSIPVYTIQILRMRYTNRLILVSLRRVSSVQKNYFYEPEGLSTLFVVRAFAIT